MDMATYRFNSSVVRQSNKLIEAKFTSYMSEQEQKFFAFIITETRKADLELAAHNQNKKIILSAKDFAYILKTQPSGIYRDAANLARNIQNKRLSIQYEGEDGKAAFEEITIIPYMNYDAGILTISVNSEILKYLLDVKEKFTSFKLEHVLRLGSGYAIKIYQLLKQYEKIGQREFDVAELKAILAIEDIKSYALYGQFKRDVLEKAMIHINMHTDIYIEYQEIKLGRRVSKINFFIKSKQTQYEQALIGFEEFINRQNEQSIMKILWLSGLKDKKELMKRFSKSFNMWLEINCKEYHPDEVRPLQYESAHSLLYDEKSNSKIIKDFYNDYRLNKS